MTGRKGTTHEPLVSVILTTRDRPGFLPIALRCYAHQTYRARDLIVVDNGEVFPADANAIAAVGGRVIRVQPGTPIGTILNHGARAARGTLCQKMDDDDWYAPRFLETMVSTLLDNQAVVCQPVVVFLMPFLFFDLARWEVRRHTENALAGSTLLFDRADWEERQFRALSFEEDLWFVRDQAWAGRKLLRNRAIGTFLAVRHPGLRRQREHSWMQIDGYALDDYLQNRPLYDRRPETLLPDWALKAYQELISGHTKESA